MLPTVRFCHKIISLGQIYILSFDPQKRNSVDFTFQLRFWSFALSFLPGHKFVFICFPQNKVVDVCINHHHHTGWWIGHWARLLFSYVHFIPPLCKEPASTVWETHQTVKEGISPKLMRSLCLFLFLFVPFYSVSRMCLVCKSSFTLGVKTDLLCHRLGIRASHSHNFLNWSQPCYA